MPTKNIAMSVFVCLITAFAAAQVTYTVKDLGPVSPTAVNSWAQVVGNYNGHAFIWTRWEGLKDLGVLDGGTFSVASGINDRGMVIGNADGPVTWPWGSGWIDIQPFLWTRSEGLVGLGVPGTPWPYPLPFYATAINIPGQIVGYNLNSGSTYAYAFSWTQGSGITLFGDNWPPTFASGINIHGKTVGTDGTFWCPGHAVWWKDGVETDLGTLGGTDPTWEMFGGSSANGVNDLGQVVGGSSTTPDGQAFHAVSWSKSGMIKDLGTLPGDSFSLALKINISGQVIGSSGNLLFNQCSDGPLSVRGRPFVWSQRSGMRDLNTLIRANSGWVLNSVSDINVWGQIVGEGTLNGKPRGFLLTPRNPFQPF